MKYYQVTVTLKNGFKYSYTCIGRMLEGMKASSESYWTEKVEVVEITKEEHFKTHNVTFTEDKVLRNAIVKSGKVVDKGKLLEPEITTGKKVRAKKSDNASVQTEKPVKLEQKKTTSKKTKNNLEDFL
jgi:hypothetical protein